MSRQRIRVRPGVRDETAETTRSEELPGSVDLYDFVKGKPASPQRAVFDAIQDGDARDPDHTELGCSHGRSVRRSIWITAADGIDSPHAARVARIGRDR